MMIVIRGDMWEMLKEWARQFLPLPEGQSFVVPPSILGSSFSFSQSVNDTGRRRLFYFPEIKRQRPTQVITLTLESDSSECDMHSHTGVYDTCDFVCMPKITEKVAVYKNTITFKSAETESILLQVNFDCTYPLEYGVSAPNVLRPLARYAVILALDP